MAHEGGGGVGLLIHLLRSPSLRDVDRFRGTWAIHKRGMGRFKFLTSACLDRFVP